MQQVRLGRFDFAYDEVRATFGALAGVAADDLVALIDETEAQVEARGRWSPAHGLDHDVGRRGDPGDVRCVDCARPGDG